MKLKEYRKLMELTQAECAAEIGVTRQYWSELERGKHQPGRKLAMKLTAWSWGAVRLADLWPGVEDDR